jgi:hypothetical protein
MKQLEMINYIKELILEKEFGSESYFFTFERKSEKFVDFRCIWCFEPGRKLYLEKQFYSNYKFLNLDDPCILQKWLSEQ